ncbi:MAG: ATP-binding protein [Pseudomonadota bacterium]
MKIYGANQTFQDMLASHNDSIPPEIQNKTSLFLSSTEEALSTQIIVEIGQTPRTFSLHLKRYIYKNEICIFLIMMDIQDQIVLAQSLEDQRAKNVQASKLSSLGEMAGGIAHEINNPLAIIHGRTKQIENILQRNLESATKNDISSIQMELTEKTKSIISTVDRINKIIKGLKAFSRDGSVDSMEVASAKAIIEDTLVFCNERFRNHGVELDVKSADQELFISCQPQQISQVLLNLLNNAFDAQVSNEVKKISVEVLSSDNFIKFRVSDYGEGVKFPDKLFQAFFTTKPVGQGTGIGLSISYGIVKKHLGNMYLESPQNPTTICFEIPATTKKAA